MSPEIWVRAFNRLLPQLDEQGPTYFSGPRFINLIREVDADHPNYGQYLDLRRSRGQSTSRKDFFYDILRDLPESARFRAMHLLVDAIEEHVPDRAAEVRAVLAGSIADPNARVADAAWNSERLNRVLTKVDASISVGEYERAVTLSYQALEGYYKAFVHHRVPELAGVDEIIALSREIKNYISTSNPGYPPEILNMIGHVSHAVDRARNRFSEAHFDQEAANWLAVYLRDLVNTQMRLLLHFFGD